jgi:ribosome-binding factor A
MRHAPTLEFILDALPESAAHIEDLLSQARQSDAAVAAAAAGATYAGDPDPYKHPGDERDDEDASDVDGLDEVEDGDERDDEDEDDEPDDAARA